MWTRVIAIALLVSACSSPAPDVPVAAGNTASPAGSTAEVPASPAALAARRVASDYFAALAAKDYGRAYLLWGNKGADSRGTLPTFRGSFARYGSYVGTAGKPGAIRVSDGVDYILVESSARTQERTGRVASLSGVVMLKRPAAAPSDATPPWTIWGTDIRDRHCPAGQSARGLGCS